MVRMSTSHCFGGWLHLEHYQKTWSALLEGRSLPGTSYNAEVSEVEAALELFSSTRPYTNVNLRVNAHLN